MPSPQIAHAMRSPLNPGTPSDPGARSPTLPQKGRCQTFRDTPASAADSCFRFPGASVSRVPSRFACRNADRPVALEIENVAAILPQSRNLRARLPSRQPVTTPIASVAQRSISTNVTRRLRSAPSGSAMPSRSHPSIAMRTPSTCPAQRCPCAIFAFSSCSSKDSMATIVAVFRRGAGCDRANLIFTGLAIQRRPYRLPPPILRRARQDQS